ncbi:uncharacterized protein K02A2.6-like [Rhodamnia argentea]|uniref:Uncharacterized protein K02A2.6-like n=1 Tax=Rhodamnia argentea TaxID=178133 RepID=A0ABM3HPN5_9MYRT|nr:uncharacterized protein K02A2.6-like [Rhodamnia argentea]
MAIEEEADGRPWYQDIMTYLQKRKFPKGSESVDRKYLMKLSSKFFLNGNALYKRSFDSVLLRCVDAKEANRLMSEIHEGECGPHMNGYLLSKKIMRVYSDKIIAPPNELHRISEAWPFSMWGIDVIGPINPQTSNGHRFILVAIDYFSKWIEANSYANVTPRTVAKFVGRDIIARYGTPEAIITDNGTNLNNKLVDEVFEEFQISHLNSSPYHPQMNGASEAANKNIKKILSKTSENYRDWHERLPYALMAYRTSIRTSTGATPFSLMYGAEAILPVEVEIPSLRVLSQAYQKQVAKSFNCKVRPRLFEIDDLVLKKRLLFVPHLEGKFTPNYEGPYVVKKVLPGSALILAEMDGQVWPSPINVDAVKKYFA